MPVLLWLGVRAEADAAEAARVHRRAVELARADELLAAFPGAGAGALAYRALAEAERARAAGTPHAASWRAAADRFDALDEPHPAAYARLREADALLTARRRPAYRGRAAGGGPRRPPSRSAPGRCARTSRRSPVAPASRRCRPPESSREPADGLLTRREADVLELLADGLTNREIAARLFISEKTVGTHIGHIYDKLGVHSRVEAAGRARAIGNT